MSTDETPTCSLASIDRMFQQLPAEFAVFKLVRHVPEHDGCQVWTVNAEDPEHVTASQTRVITDLGGLSGLHPMFDDLDDKDGNA